jgi:hypothetical protein
MSGASLGRTECLAWAYYIILGDSVEGEGGAEGGFYNCLIKTWIMGEEDLRYCWGFAYTYIRMGGHRGIMKF